MDVSLIIPAFIAGLLTFLAPCTFPLVPGYLGFIGGVSAGDLKNPETGKRARWKIFMNGVFYVVGFSAVFIFLGTVFSIGGIVLARYRTTLSQIGGIFVIFFGLYMTRVFSLPLLDKFPLFNFLRNGKQFGFGAIVQPGKPLSSFIFGATFAFGWTPCVGPILGSILLLASTTATVAQGAFLLLVFSFGLAAPFLLIAASVSSASRYVGKISKYLNAISMLGGIFLVFLGYLLLTNSFSAWTSYFYRTFNFINYDQLLNYL